MKRFLKILLLLLLIAAIADGIRYLQPHSKNKQTILLQKQATKITKIIFVYNAYGGIYPGIVDFFHKELFPSSYPCNLCYQSFGTFGMKDEWKTYLDSLSYQKTFLHKEKFKRGYLPENLPLPSVLASDGNSTWQLLSASEINKAKSLDELIHLLNQKLNP